MDSKLDYIDIASQIYTRLEMEYGFAKEFPPKIPKLLMTMRRCARLRTERSDDLVKYLQVKQNV